MLTIDAFETHGPLNILCLGAHCDDIEIGCGATILRLLREHPDAVVRWVVFSGDGERADEARKSAAEFLGDTGAPEIVVKDFRDGFFPYVGYEIKEYFESLKTGPDPDIVLTHYREDRHQDHRVINELTWNTFRDHFVLEYEIPKYDGDMGIPNYFVNVDDDLCRRKVDLVWKHFASQRGKPWLTTENLQALMRIRGIEARSPSGFAEGFYCRKMVW